MRHVDDLIADLANEGVVKPMPSGPWLLFAGWVMGYIVYIALCLLIYPLRPDLGAMLSQPLYSAELASLVAVLLTTAWSAAVLSYPDIHQKRLSLLLPLMAFTVFTGVTIVAWRADLSPSPPPAHDIDCLLCITGMAVLPALYMLYRTRKMATTHPMLSGASCLLAAFSLGALTLRLSEETNSITHVIEAHYLPMIIVAFTGIFVGKKIFKW